MKGHHLNAIISRLWGRVAGLAAFDQATNVNYKVTQHMMVTMGNARRGHSMNL